MLVMKERVNVVDKTESGLSCCNGCLCRDRPSVEFLRPVAELIVVSVEGIESSEPESSA